MGLGEAGRGGMVGGPFSPRACGARLAAEGCFPKSKAAGRRGWAAAGSSACTVPLRAGSGVPMPPKNSVFPRLGWIPCRAGVPLPGAGTAATSLPAGQPQVCKAQVRAGGSKPERGSTQPQNHPHPRKIGGRPGRAARSVGRRNHGHPWKWEWGGSRGCFSCPCWCL